MSYPTKGIAKPAPNISSQQERLQALLGDRGKTGDMKAITRADVAALGTINIKSVLVTAAPTAAQFNDLVTDLKTIAALLNKLGARFDGL